MVSECRAAVRPYGHASWRADNQPVTRLDMHEPASAESVRGKIRSCWLGDEDQALGRDHTADRSAADRARLQVDRAQ